MIDANTALVSARIAAIILKGAAALGADPSALAQCTDFDPRCLDDADARIPLAQENALWSAAATATGDPFFGLHLAEMIRPGQFDVLDYVVRTAPTLASALQRLARYNRLMHDLAEFALTESAAGILVEHYFAHPQLLANRHAAEFTLASLLIVAEQMAGIRPPVLHVAFKHAAPAETRELHRVFGIHPHFGATRNSVLFAPAALQAPVPDADAALSRILTRHADQILASLERPRAASLSHRVSQLILEHMAEGRLNLASIAARLHLGERSLQRALQAEGSSFNRLLDEVRRKSAQDLIADQHLALGEVAYLLGFSEPSAFHRAYKRWTGQTPMAARQSRRQAP